MAVAAAPPLRWKPIAQLVHHLEDLEAEDATRREMASPWGATYTSQAQESLQMRA